MKQIDKNTVSAKGQLISSRFVTFDNREGKDIKVMFVGNSITLHGVLPSIGWNNEWGMAASAKENDYVHIIEDKVKVKHPDAAFCICQVAEWERKFDEGEKTFPLYESARDFGADIVIFRFIENCPQKEELTEKFYSEYGKLLEFLTAKNKATQIIITNGFWKHIYDKQIEKFAIENNYPFVDLGDLGELDEMKAIGLFEHSGVANHPGDLGMKNIAERILKKMNF